MKELLNIHFYFHYKMQGGGYYGQQPYYAGQPNYIQSPRMNDPLVYNQQPGFVGQPVVYGQQPVYYGQQQPQVVVV